MTNPTTGVALGSVLFFIILTCAEAWGPLSHFYFASQAFPTFDSDSMKLGCDLPDGFYFANWAQFPECEVPIEYMHTGAFPGYLLQYALTKEANKHRTADFDPVSMALAFGSHIYADVVGFFNPFGGYLGPTVPNYATTWPLMTAIDALVATRIPFDLNSKLSSEEAAEFVAAGTAFRQRTDPTFPIFNASAIKTCSDNWGDAGLKLIKLAMLQADSTYFEQALIYYDQFNATTFEQTSHNFDLANGCAVKGIQFWAAQIMREAKTPQEAFSASYAYIVGLFRQGLCTPVPVSQ